MNAHSMTGFGHGSVSRGGLRVEVDISSVNRKQLDVVTNLPKSLGVLEARLLEEVAGTVVRGRLSVSIRIRDAGGPLGGSVRVDDALAATYVKALRTTARRLKLPDDLSARALLDLAGVVRREEPSDDVETVWPLIQLALRKALEALQRMRAREGRALARDLAARLRQMKTWVEEIRDHAPAAVVRFRDALRQRLEVLRDEAGLTDGRLEREVVLFADRSDITEELTRLGSHLAQAVALLQDGKPAGKALDFVAQEMGREINTIGSKANDAEIARRVVLFKTELDRFREQVQNIE